MAHDPVHEQPEPALELLLDVSLVERCGASRCAGGMA
jgi:hypothetical protein